jgi:integrase/recombinase XerD
MKTFSNYLKTKQYSSRTISDDIKNVMRFLKWYKQDDLQNQAQLTVAELASYINTLQKQEISPQVINQRLRSIKKYYEFLKSEGYQIAKLEKVIVKGQLKKVIVDPIEYSDLEQLYSDYTNYREERQAAHGKNFAGYAKATLLRKVMLGLLVFQGLRSAELKRIEVNHINENDGTLYIPSSRKSASRELKLLSSQMRPLFKLLDSLPVDQAGLFSKNLDNQLFALLDELRGLNNQVQNATHIRASVILHWLQLHGKRRTQYMIGHKWISSTEHYELQNLEELTNLLENHHPFVNH